MVAAKHVVVIGQGYVGLPLAVRGAEVGYDVTGLDVDAARVESLQNGESYVEDISAERLIAALETGRYRASSDPDDAAGFDIAVISVPTPLRDGAPDLGHVEDAAANLARFLRPGATVILESTTYPGTTEELVGPLLEAGSGLRVGEFHLGYSPERIDPGNKTWTLETTPKLVSGVDRASLVKVQEFFDRIVNTTVPVTSPKEAELTKLLENTFRHVNIALINELAMFAGDLGVDIWEVVRAASTKPFGFMPFTPGPGVGGHCLPIDPSYLSWRVRKSLGQTFRFVELANDVNEHMPDYVVRRLADAFNVREMSVKGREILLLGLAYKKNTGDARESPAAVVAKRLLALGASVSAVDPHIISDHVPPGVRRTELCEAEVDAADAVVVLVDHSGFDMAIVAERAKFVLDTRNVVPSGMNVERL